MHGVPDTSAARTKGRAGSTGSPAEEAWTARKRRIGQRGSQTETIRGMIELHQPFPRPPVAAPLERHFPACARDQPEAVARGLGRADAPARRGRARLSGLRPPPQPDPPPAPPPPQLHPPPRLAPAPAL